MVAILQIIYWNQLSWMEMCDFFYKNFTECCSQRSNKQYPSISSDNGLAQTMGQIIIWANDGSYTNAHMWHLASIS